MTDRASGIWEISVSDPYHFDLDPDPDADPDPHP